MSDSTDITVVRVFQQRLDDESLVALSGLFEGQVWALLSPWVNVELGRSFLTVGSVSIPLDASRFLIVDNDWADTPRWALDYFSLSLRVCPSPKGIFYNPVLDDPAMNYHYRSDHLALHVGPVSDVERIDVLACREQHGNEAVDYDAGLLIVLADARRLVIVCKHTIAAFLYILHSESDIEEFTEDLTVRLSLTRAAWKAQRDRTL